MNHHGLILCKLRELNHFTIKQAATYIGRSAGWLSSVESGQGACRIHLEEFNRIVTAYNGDRHRKHFSMWIANAQKASIKSEGIQFTGSILKYLRKKAQLSLDQVAAKVGFSIAYLSYLENGVKPLTPDLRDKLTVLYGYSPKSFRNFRNNETRAKNIPSRYKLDLLIKQLSDEQLEKILVFAVQSISKPTMLETKQ